MHGKTVVAAHFVEALSRFNGTRDGVVVVVDAVIPLNRVDASGNTKSWNKRVIRHREMTSLIFEVEAWPTSIFIPEQLVLLECSCRTIRDFNAGRLAIIDTVPAESRIGLGGDQNSSLGVSEYLVVLQKSPSLVEDADSTITTVVDLVSSERRLTVSLDPDTSHCVVEDFIV